MKMNVRLGAKSVWVILGLLALPLGQQRASAQEKTNKPPARPTSGVKFRPQTGSAPPVRVTGGSRGSGDTAITLDVLAPDESGVTIQAQPSLFWFQSKPAEAKFELTLLQERQVKPLVHVKTDHASKAGIQRLKLADYGVKLTPGVEYQWVLALITDPENRSGDLVASGVIKRVEPSSDLKQKLTHASPESLPNIYAEAGIWYDALAALSDRIDAQPENATLHETRADLLRQVGLKAAATADAASALPKK